MTAPEDDILQIGASPIVIIEFSQFADRACIEWFLSRLSAKDFAGGAELQVTPLNSQDTLFGLNATDGIFLTTAHLQDLKMIKEDGLLHMVDSEDVSRLTMAQRQQMIEFRIDCLQPTEREALPGHPKLIPDMQKPLITSLKEFKIVSQIFPIHDPEELKVLHKDWITSSKPYIQKNAVDQIRNYFGDEIAIYFAFVRHLAMFLLPPATLPFFECIWPSHIVSRQAALATFNMVWLTIFIESWKRRSAELAYRWGTISRKTLERPRPAYFGRMCTSEVTGKLERYYPKWKRQIRFWFVSMPVMILSLVVTFWIMIGYLWLDELTQVYAAKTPAWYNPILVALPGVAYSILLLCMNPGFRKLALLLNHFENHRLQSSFDNHYVLKLITFYTINGFLCLFYKAFYIRDLQAVKETLATLLITSQIVNQVMESLIPFITYKLTKKIQSKSENTSDAKGLLGRIQREAIKPQVEGTIDEYIELYLQFGYVCLFSSLLPWAAVCAFLNNLVELKSDAFKLCRLHQRPFAKIAADIGAWRYGFEFLAYLAVCTNCGLLYLSPEVQSTIVKESGPLATFAVLVIFEHMLICVKVGISNYIDDQPKGVKVGLAKLEYQTEMAWRDRLNSEARKRDKDE